MRKGGDRGQRRRGTKIIPSYKLWEKTFTREIQNTGCNVRKSAVSENVQKRKNKRHQPNSPPRLLNFPPELRKKTQKKREKRREKKKRYRYMGKLVHVSLLLLLLRISSLCCVWKCATSWSRWRRCAEQKDVYLVLRVTKKEGKNVIKRTRIYKDSEGGGRGEEWGG